MNILNDDGVKTIFLFCFFTITIPVILYELIFNMDHELSSNMKVYMMVIPTAISIFNGIYLNARSSQDNGLND